MFCLNPIQIFNYAKNTTDVLLSRRFSTLTAAEVSTGMKSE